MRVTLTKDECSLIVVALDRLVDSDSLSEKGIELARRVRNKVDWHG